MADFIQPQRVPIGEFKDPQGRMHKVTITIEWFKVLSRLAQAVTDSSSGGDSEEDDFSPLELMVERAAEADDNEPTDLVSVFVFSLSKRVQALEAAPDLSELQAQIQRLAERITALENAP